MLKLKRLAKLAKKLIAFVSHTGKVVQKVILDMLKPQAEPNVAEEEAGRSATDQIVNFFEGYLKHLYPVFIDFNGELHFRRKYNNISPNVVLVIQHLFFTMEEPETGLQQLQLSMDAFSFLLSRITVDVLAALMTESSA